MKLAKGRVFLLVTGIIYIIVGVFSVLAGVIIDITSQAIDGLGNMVGVDDAGLGLGILAIITVASGVYAFVMGVLGITWRNTIEKGKVLLILGCISIVVDIVGAIALGFSISTILMLAMPACYIVGAYKNMRECANPTPPESNNTI